MKKIAILSLLATAFISQSALAEVSPYYEFKGTKFKLEKIEDWSRVFPNRTRSSEIKHIDLSSYPRTLSFREDQTEVKNQGGRLSCTFFVTTSLIEGSLKSRFHQELNLSEEHMIFNTKSTMGDFPKTATSIVYYNMVAFGTHGLALESDSPYQETWFQNGFPCSQYTYGEHGVPLRCYSHDKPKLAEDRIMRLEGDDWFGWFETKDDEVRSQKVIETMNRTGLAVSASVPMESSHWNRETGVAEFSEELFLACAEPGNSELNCGGHAIVLTGYDLDKEVFYFKNSWGNDWGDKGYGTISFEYINNWAYHDYTYFFDAKAPLDTPIDYSIPTEALNIEVETNGFIGELFDARFKGLITGLPYGMGYLYGALFDKEGKLVYGYDRYITFDSRGEYQLKDLDFSTAFNLTEIPESYTGKELEFRFYIISADDIGYKQIEKYTSNFIF